MQQEDTSLGTLTVRENLMFSAELRVPREYNTSAECRARVERVVEELNLAKCADSLVGTELLRGVSGGERRRLSIGLELIKDPSILFLVRCLARHCAAHGGVHLQTATKLPRKKLSLRMQSARADHTPPTHKTHCHACPRARSTRPHHSSNKDEPTTGLDATVANVVVRTLKQLARGGRTVLLSIHQPRFSIFREFDGLSLIADGSMVYHGPAGDSLRYFSAIGFEIEPHNNPAGAAPPLCPFLFGPNAQGPAAS